jgi:hydroxyacylglutathione hydrolase
LEGLPEFASWILPYGRPIALVLEDSSHAGEAMWALAHPGFYAIAGYLRGGIGSWYDAPLPVEHLPLMSIHELKATIERKEEIFMLDVRSAEERQSGYIEGSHHFFVGYLSQRLSEVPRDKPVAVICSVGNRAQPWRKHHAPRWLPPRVQRSRLNYGLARRRLSDGKRQ